MWKQDLPLAAAERVPNLTMCLPSICLINRSVHAAHAAVFWNVRINKLFKLDQ